MIFAPQIKIIGALVLVSMGLGYALYWQIGKTAETSAALATLQAQLAAQLDENKRVNDLLIKHQRDAQAERLKTQQARRDANHAINSKPKEDCVNTVIPDDLRLLIKSS